MVTFYLDEMVVEQMGTKTEDDAVSDKRILQQDVKRSRGFSMRMNQCQEWAEWT